MCARTFSVPFINRSPTCSPWGRASVSMQSVEACRHSFHGEDMFNGWRQYEAVHGLEDQFGAKRAIHSGGTCYVTE